MKGEVKSKIRIKCSHCRKLAMQSKVFLLWSIWDLFMGAILLVISTLLRGL